VGLIWKDPPEDRRPTYRVYETEAQQLRDSPGTFAVISTFELNKSAAARGLVSQIRSGRLAVFRPAGVFEAESHQENINGRDVVAVYARYTGD
jgi:hypothetical protein